MKINTISVFQKEICKAEKQSERQYILKNMLNMDSRVLKFKHIKRYLQCEYFCSVSKGRVDEVNR